MYRGDTSDVRFVDDPSLAVSMGEQSRRIAEEKYDVHKVNAVMLQEMEISKVDSTHAVAE